MNNKIKLIAGSIIINITFIIYNISDNGFIREVVKAIYVKLLRCCSLSFYPIESNETYQNKYANCIFQPIVINRSGVTGNVLMADNIDLPSVNYHRLPDIRLIRYTDVCITGDSDIIVDLNNKCIISDYCYNIDTNVTFIDGLLYRHKLNLCVLRNNFKKEPTHIQSGIMISGKFSMNYFHEMYENLNRLLLLSSSDVPSDVPILVDEIVNAVPSLKKILEILTVDSNREIVYIKPRQVYHFYTLYYLDHINMMAPHIRSMQLNKDYYVYDPIRMKELREKILVYKADIETPKRIFLTRASTSHRHFNEGDVFDTLMGYGFQKVAPENYSLEEQIALFNNAEWIIGGTGAAFTNLLFCREGCKVLCLRSSNIGVEPPIFNTIAYINKCKMWYYAPDKMKSSKSRHSDFYINAIRFESIVQRLFAIN
jgi:capsular polysaccharide biosynthesis protein